MLKRVTKVVAQCTASSWCDADVDTLVVLGHANAAVMVKLASIQTAENSASHTSWHDLSTSSCYRSARSQCPDGCRGVCVELAMFVAAHKRSTARCCTTFIPPLSDYASLVRRVEVDKRRSIIDQPHSMHCRSVQWRCGNGLETPNGPCMPKPAASAAVSRRAAKEEPIECGDRRPHGIPPTFMPNTQDRFCWYGFR